MSTNVYATQDTYTLANSRYDNFEGADLLVQGSPNRAYTYLEFDLSSFAGKTIQEAVIKLYIVVNNLTSDTNIRFYRIDRSWDAGEATYNNPPHVTSTNAKRKTLENEDSGWEGWNITDLVQDIVEDGGYGVRVEIDADAMVWFSHIDGGHQAKLEITEVPVISSNGFTINVATGLATKTLFVAHVVKLPHYGLPGVDPGPDIWYWPEILGYVGGEWYMADPATKYRVEVGSIDETIPPFDKTHGFGSFADGIDCVVMALGTSGVGTLLFKDEDVFRLNKDSPTEIYLSSTSNDIISDGLMGPVCDLFGIARGTACQSFWAEIFDPMFVANYVCIKNTGKDLLGNDRELSIFDHIALPFAILGSLPGLSLLPFGAFVTKGLKTSAKFGDEAVRFMLNFSMDAANKVSTKDTWHFLDAIGQVTEDHATEIVNALTAGDTNLANTLLRKYAGESKGWWDYRKLNDMLQDALPAEAYNWLRTQIGLTEIGAGTVTNVAKQATLSPDCVLKLADAVKDTGVMDEATLGVYRSLKSLDTATPKYIDEVRNILKNSPEISAKLMWLQVVCIWIKNGQKRS